ncbi:Feruloyl CoA ortho-hydroxylase 1 [Capsicum chinense]|nr:Feruloyl CoA ortho-hydroxylase 1 [Capsicum chinense]
MPTKSSIDLSNITDFVVNEGHGVKGFSEMGIQKIPKQYIQPIKERSITTTPTILDDQIPVIDMSNWNIDNNIIVEKICNAAEKWVFFQIINHDISLQVLESIKEATYRFFKQPAHSKENSSTNNVRYGTRFTPKAEKALEWKDYLSLFYVSDDEAASLWPSALSHDVDRDMATDQGVQNVKK